MAMSLVTYSPRAPLSEYVAMFWAWEDYNMPHSRERILPIGMMEITFDLDGGRFIVSDDASDAISFRGPMVVGPRSKHFVIDTSRSMSLLSILFKPGGALPFLNISGSELHNQHAYLDNFWGRDADNLYCQLLDAPTTAARFEILEATLLLRLQRVHVRHRAVVYALKLLQQVPHAQTIRDITNTIALSPPHFIRLFKEETGLTPKLFSRVQRFRYALDMITKYPTPNWTDIALTSGYYDQSHFINEFQTFAGIAPSQYAPQSREHNVNLPEPS